MPVSGPLTRLVGPTLTNPLQALGEQTGQLCAAMHDALGDLQRALDLLQGGAGLDAYAGQAARMLAETAAALTTQMTDFAQASDSVSQIAYRCASNLGTAANNADRAAPDWGTLSDATATINTGDVARNGDAAGSVAEAKVRIQRGPAMLTSVERQSDAAATAAAVTTWARATRDAATTASSQVAGVTQSVSETLAGGLRSSLPQLVSPTPIGPLVRIATSESGGVGEQRAAVALQLSRYARGQNALALNEAALAHDHPEWAGAAHAALASGASDGDAQCVAFMYLVYALSQSTAQDAPPLPKGDAETMWDAPDFAPPKWARIANGQGLPHPGDIMVMADGGPGHVAIITGVSQHPPHVTFANGMAPADPVGPAREALHTFPMTAEGRVESTWGKQSTILGFLRQVG